MTSMPNPENQPPEIAVTWWGAVQVWWAMTWRVLLVMVVIGGLVGLLSHSLALPSMMREELEQLASMMIIPVGIWAMRTVLNKNYRGFRLALMPKEEPKDTEADE
ncbi:MAG: hypothetical protein ACPG80_00775 [Rickettsiales bacterium]